MAALVYFNYIGALIPIAFFIADCFLYLKRKIRIDFLYPYFVSLLFFTPFIWTLKRTNFAHGWPKKPLPIELLTFPKNLLDGSFFVFLFLFAVAILLVYLLLRIVCKKRINWRYSLLTVFLWTIVFAVFALYEYSIIASGINNTSLWMPRYLYTLLPYLYLLCAFGAVTCIDFLCRGNITVKTILFICLAAFLFSNTLKKVDWNNRNFGYPHGPHKDWADYLIAQKDIYDKNTALFIRAHIWGDNKPDGRGLQVWKNYYVSRKGTKTPFFFANYEDIEQAVYKRLYVLIDPNDKETYISDKKYKQSFTKDIYGAKVLVYDRIEN